MCVFFGERERERRQAQIVHAFGPLIVLRQIYELWLEFAQLHCSILGEKNNNREELMLQ